LRDLVARVASLREQLGRVLAQARWRPPGVQALLASLPVGISPFDRVQAVRQALTTRLSVLTGGPGTGKTTTAAKLARLIAAQKKKVLLVSADVYRPAAIDQLKMLAQQVGVDFFPSAPAERPAAMTYAPASRASWIAIEPTTPAAPWTRTLCPG